MPRILYLFSHYPRWSETFLRQDLKLLQQTGLPLLPVSLYPGDCSRKDDWPEVTVLSQDSIASPSAFSPGRFSLRLPRLLRQYLSLYRHRRVLSLLTALIRSHNITAIHAEFADLAALLASEASRRIGIPYSLSIHAFDVHACKYPLQTIYGKASRIITCNQAAMQALLSQNPGLNEKTVKIYHGLILQNWPFRPHRSFPRNSVLRLLFVGRFVPKKGLFLLLEGLAVARNHGMNFSLNLVGEGPCSTALRAQAEKLNLTKQIIWSGRTDRSCIPAIMSQSDLFIMPSIVTSDRNQDGIPNVVVEAMTSGLPVMGSQEGSLSEILTENTGWPIPILTPEHIFQSLEQFLSQPEEQILQKPRNARLLVEKSFDAEKLAQVRKEALLSSIQQPHAE